MIEGQWQNSWYDTSKSAGAFTREPTQFRLVISTSSNERFPAEKRRYHLGVHETVNFLHIKQRYYFSHKMINPTQIVPLGPKLKFD